MWGESINDAQKKVRDLLKILWGFFNCFCLQLIYSDAIFHGRRETWEMDARISRIKTNKPNLRQSAGTLKATE